MTVGSLSGVGGKPSLAVPVELAVEPPPGSAEAGGGRFERKLELAPLITSL